MCEALRGLPFVFRFVARGQISLNIGYCSTFIPKARPGVLERIKNGLRILKKIKK